MNHSASHGYHSAARALCACACLCVALASSDRASAQSSSLESELWNLPPSSNLTKDRPGADPNGQASVHAGDHLKVGALVGVSFPRPLSAEAIVQLERSVALGAEYSALRLWLYGSSRPQCRHDVSQSAARLFVDLGPWHRVRHRCRIAGSVIEPGLELIAGGGSQRGTTGGLSSPAHPGKRRESRRSDHAAHGGSDPRRFLILKSRRGDERRTSARERLHGARLVACFGATQQDVGHHEGKLAHDPSTRRFSLACAALRMRLDRVATRVFCWGGARGHGGR